MSLNRTPKDKQTLSKIEELFRRIDQQTLHAPDPVDYPEALLFQLKALIAELEFSAEPELQKCSRLQDHLMPGMPRRHFLNLLIPIERALGREVKDSDFLVTSTDHNVDPSAGSAAATLDHSIANLKRSARPLVFVLENIRSAFNVGSILRLADGVGCQQVLLTGYTAGVDSPAVQKTSLGAAESLKIQHFENTLAAIEELRKANYQIVGLETAGSAKPLFGFEFQKPTALIVGNERFGLDPQTLSACDALVVLPLVGMKNSLNVATALSAVAFEWTRQHP